MIELSSRKTWKADLTAKKDIYAWLGVREYFVFDPEYKLSPTLRAFRLHGTELIEEMVMSNRVMSRELGLELVNNGETLRLYQPTTGEFLRTPSETYAHAEEETSRANRLAAKLRELGLDPDNL